MNLSSPCLEMKKSDLFGSRLAYSLPVYRVINCGFNGSEFYHQVASISLRPFELNWKQLMPLEIN